MAARCQTVWGFNAPLLQLQFNHQIPGPESRQSCVIKPNLKAVIRSIRDYQTIDYPTLTAIYSESEGFACL